MKPSEMIFEAARSLNHGTDATGVTDKMLISAIIAYLDEEHEINKANADALAKRPTSPNKTVFNYDIYRLYR